MNLISESAEYHYFYSQKQEEVLSKITLNYKRYKNFALIDDKEVQYTCSSDSAMNSGCFFDDIVYLGRGNYHQSIEV